MKNQVLIRCLLSLLFLASSGCRSPDELSEIITAQIFVIGVDEDQWVELEIEDQVVATESHAAANLLQFSLALGPGIHEGTITVFELERNERRHDDDDGWRRPDDDEIEAYRCGAFAVEVPEQMNPTHPVSIAIVVEDLGPCDDENDDEERDRRNRDNDRSRPNDDSPDDDNPDDSRAAEDDADEHDSGPHETEDETEDENDDRLDSDA